MNFYWARSNKFLLALLAVAVVVVGVLTSLVMRQQHDLSTVGGQVRLGTAPTAPGASVPAGADIGANPDALNHPGAATPPNPANAPVDPAPAPAAVAPAPAAPAPAAPAPDPAPAGQAPAIPAPVAPAPGVASTHITPALVAPAPRIPRAAPVPQRPLAPKNPPARPANPVPAAPAPHQSAPEQPVKLAPQTDPDDPVKPDYPVKPSKPDLPSKPDKPDDSGVFGYTVDGHTKQTGPVVAGKPADKKTPSWADDSDGPAPAATKADRHPAPTVKVDDSAVPCPSKSVVDNSIDGAGGDQQSAADQTDGYDTD